MVVKMGLWTKSQRDAAKRWVAENSEILCRSYLQGHSILHLQQQAPIKVGRDLLQDLLTISGIPLRGLQQNGKPLQVEKARRTSLEKFGVANASSLPEIKAKRAATFLRKLGVENPFQCKKIQQQIRSTCIERYGHPHPGAHSLKRVKISTPHMLLSAALVTSAIQHKNEVVVYNPTIFSKYKSPRIDILIGSNFAVEVFGDYFHANPEKYKPSDLISRFKGKVEARQIWEEDAKRLESLRKCGYQVMVVWEKDIKYNLQQVLKDINAALENHQD